MPKPYYEYNECSNDDEYCFSEAALYLRDCFRLLWEQHVYWTRMTIISIALDLPDLAFTTKRLLRNAPDFAKIFRYFYGDKIASEFNRLLTDHLVIAAELVKAAKAGDSKAVEAAEKKWYSNADEIVCFLNDINPNWSVEHMRAMWYKHLALTKEEAVARLSKNYAKDIALFNQIEKEALLMADSFFMGISCQFSV